jgi:hypothetical protein
LFYFCVGVIITIYLYIIENIKTKNSFELLFLLFPVFYIYTIGPAFQYGVGSDYFHYLRMYTVEVEERLFYAGEYSFYYIVKFLRYFELGEQSMYIVTSIIQASLFFIILEKLKKYKFKRWLVFLIFFIVTGIYFNQMNTLRQFVAILSAPIFFIYLYEKKYFKVVLISLFALSFHSTFIIIILFGSIFIFLKNFNKKIVFIIFLISPIVLLFIFPLFAQIIFESLFPVYAKYLNTDTSRALRIVVVKVYYIPIIFLFWFIYIKDKMYYSYNSVFFKYIIILFSLTSFFYLLDFSVFMHGRIFQYFYFFYIFPIYYLIEYFYTKKYFILLQIISLYISLPFFLKIFVFKLQEYSYDSILFY